MLLACYRALLLLCPARVRRECGREMEAVFVECVRRERQRRGRWRRSIVWVPGLLDVVMFATRARWDQARSGGRALRSLARQPGHAVRRAPVFVHDLRGSLRVMRAQPIMSLAIVLMLAVGVGATTAIFSVVYGVLLKPLPFPDADRLVQVSGTLPSRGWTRITLTEANFWDLHDQNSTLESFGMLGFGSFTLTGLDAPERISAGRVTTGFFRSLGVRPVAGRLFEPGEDQPGRGEALAMLSHRFWIRRFAADTGVVGRSISLDGRLYTVVGVLPPGSPWLDAGDAFVPFLRRANPNRGSFEYTGVARVKAGVSIDAAAADLSAIAKRLEAAYPAVNTGLGVIIQGSRSWIANDQLRRTLLVLLGAVVLLLFIACINVTNLLLVRASGRAREYAVRTALGATRADLVRERLTDSLLYSVVGATAGWFLASWMLRTLQALRPAGIPRLADVTLNGWVLAFAIGASLLVGLITGLIPAMRTPIANVVSALRQGGRGSAGDRSQSRMRQLFVATQVALALVLLVGAGLLVRSLLGVLAVDRGFQSENRLLLTVSVPSSYGAARLEQTNQLLIDRIAALPDVASVAAVSGRPLSPGSTGLGLAAADKPDIPGAPVPWATWRVITPDYFKAMGLPLLAGREFTPQDVIAKPWRAVISKRTADLLWPGENPIGKSAILWKGQSNRATEIIGVVGDMRERGLENDPTLAVYFPAGGAMDATTLQLVVHTKATPGGAIPPLRAAISAVDPSLPVSNIRTLDEIVMDSVATRRITMWLLIAFAALALMLALAGVYGVLAYSISSRTSEIGVRLALGAGHGRVLRAMIVQGMMPVLAGGAVGLVIAIAASRLMQTMLFEIRPHDPITYATVLLAVGAVAGLACYLPARRVLRLDPSIALRTE
jgi:putative ABC transport system permease protein